MGTKKSITNSAYRLHEPLYIQLYTYYKELIEAGTLKAGTKLPSIRKCAMERRMSRTTVEAAYMQLAAEGYVMPQAGSGFYVSELEYPSAQPMEAQPKLPEDKQKIRYDLASATVDRKSFNFDIWRRYIKSALRNTERLLSYGDVQGEYDLRKALCDYVREKRGVVCTPEQIVVGAGVQSLLQILCSLTGSRSPVAFTGMVFKQGEAVFQDRGVETLRVDQIDEDYTCFEERKVAMLYTSPSHITPWGGVMPMKIRLGLLAFAEKNNCLIIEDDYDSEFNYYTRPTPSLQGLDGGRHVVYMSTFSKLLVPSLRVSFMVLPIGLMKQYEDKGRYYNQTVSKVEQIALCQFIRDGHLEKQIKKARKVYMGKQEKFIESIESVFGTGAIVQKGSGGFLICVEVPTQLSVATAREHLLAKSIQVSAIEKGEQGLQLTLSYSSMQEEVFIEALEGIRQIVCP